MMDHRGPHHLHNLQPSTGFTVAQLGPPSLPVPGNRASMSSLGLVDAFSIISQVMPPKGTLILRSQQEPICPADLPMLM